MRFSSVVKSILDHSLKTCRFLSLAVFIGNHGKSIVLQAENCNRSNFEPNTAETDSVTSAQEFSATWKFRPLKELLDSKRVAALIRDGFLRQPPEHP